MLSYLSIAAAAEYSGRIPAPVCGCHLCHNLGHVSISLFTGLSLAQPPPPVIFLLTPPQGASSLLFPWSYFLNSLSTGSWQLHSIVIASHSVMVYQKRYRKLNCKISLSFGYVLCCLFEAYQMPRFNDACIHKMQTLGVNKYWLRSRVPASHVKHLDWVPSSAC